MKKKLWTVLVTLVANLILIACGSSKSAEKQVATTGKRTKKKK